MKYRLRLLLVALAATLAWSGFMERRKKPEPSDPAPKTGLPDPPPPNVIPVNLVTEDDLVRLESPYRPMAHMYRGQLHAHTTMSDGKQGPLHVMAAYRNAGYSFVSITDHNVHTADPRVPGILFIPGVENDYGHLHENRINRVWAATGERKPQDVIDLARREGSFVQINHPDWPGSYPKNPAWSDEALLAVHGYDAIEMWNASDDGTNINAESRVDFLLSNGKRTLLTAVDDCHDVRSPYCMTSSVNVFADSLLLVDIMENLKSGNYYSSSGALITSIVAENRTITVTVPKTCDIEFIAVEGKVVKSERAVLSSSYAVQGGEKYVRIRATRIPDRRQAWTNPIYVPVPPIRPDGP